MSDKTPNSLGEVLGAPQASWRRFVDVYEPLRPDLYRYCRYLTRSPWDAEDLAQDTLARAFATLGSTTDPPTNPRAWLFRVASNLWIDRARRDRDVAEPSSETTAAVEPQATREAAATLISWLSPHERAAVVLSDVFDFSISEIAESLETTEGTVKSALHRGRGKLVAPEDRAPTRPAPRVLDAFRDAFNARDLAKLTALLLDNVAVEVVGVHTSHGREAARAGALTGMLFGSERMAAADRRGGMDPRMMHGVLPTAPRFEIRELRGEFILVSFYDHADGEAVRAITRVETDGDHITGLRNYFYTPELLGDVCSELGLTCRTNGYRYWPPPGEGTT